MIFEQEYGAWLTQELNTAIRKINGNLVCRQYDEVGYKPLVKSPDEIAVVISGGNATRSSVAGLDQNVLPLSVTVICKEQYSTPVRNAIDSVQKQYNAVPLQRSYYDAVSDTNISTNIKAIFTTPFVFTHDDYKTERETIKAAFISFSASVFYGETAVVNPVPITLKIGGTVYQVEHIAEYHMTALPAYESYLPQGSERAKQCELSRTNTYNFLLYKVAGDDLQQIFENELLCEEGGLAGKTLALNFGAEDIITTTYELTEAYVNNSASYSLVLGV